MPPSVGRRARPQSNPEKFTGLLGVSPGGNTGC